MVQFTESRRLDTLVYKLKGHVTADEVAVMEPALREKEAAYGSVNLMIFFDLNDESLNDAVRELKMAVKHKSKIAKVAYLGEGRWWKSVIAVDNMFVKFKEKFFDKGEEDQAWEWLTGPDS